MIMGMLTWWLDKKEGLLEKYFSRWLKWGLWKMKARMIIYADWTLNSIYDDGFLLFYFFAYKKHSELRLLS